MTRKIFPQIYFYDQDFIDIYERTWQHVEKYWLPIEEGLDQKYFYHPTPEEKVIDQYSSIFSTFFLTYSNRNYIAETNIDYFYRKQEHNGAIRCQYNLKTGQPIVNPENPESIGLPVFAWVEYNIYHKTANKKRLKEVLSVLENHMQWIIETCKDSSGLFKAPVLAMNIQNGPRKSAVYPIDFNACVALNAFYLAEIADILNEKELQFKYKKIYFGIKTKINEKMWDSETRFYYDLDAEGKFILTRTLSSYWTLVTEIPNDDKVQAMVSYLSDPQYFGTDNPFPSLAVSDENFNENGNGYCGSVFPELTYIVIKGLQKYKFFELSREYSIRHIYFVLETLSPSNNKKISKELNAFWEAYNPVKDGPALWEENNSFPRKDYILTEGLSTIALMIENVLGLDVSLPRKTIDWTIASVEEMGIQNLSLKKNMIRKIVTKQTIRGWEIKIENEKLYYFTINILDQKMFKRLPIPSGTCSMLIEKL